MLPVSDQNRPFSPWQLGAPLYMPATGLDLRDIANGDKLPQLRAMIFCTEDAVLKFEVDSCIRHLGLCMQGFREAKQRFASSARVIRRFSRGCWTCRTSSASTASCCRSSRSTIFRLLRSIAGHSFQGDADARNPRSIRYRGDARTSSGLAAGRSQPAHFDAPNRRQRFDESVGHSQATEHDGLPTPLGM